METSHASLTRLTLVLSQLRDSYSPFVCLPVEMSSYEVVDLFLGARMLVLELVQEAELDVEAVGKNKIYTVGQPRPRTKTL